MLHVCFYTSYSDTPLTVTFFGKSHVTEKSVTVVKYLLTVTLFPCPDCTNILHTNNILDWTEGSSERHVSAYERMMFTVTGGDKGDNDSEKGKHISIDHISRVTI